MKDAPIMAAAVVCAANILVTGDRRDFGHLFGQSIEGVRVMSPGGVLGEVLMIKDNISQVSGRLAE